MRTFGLNKKTKISKFGQKRKRNIRFTSEFESDATKSEDNVKKNKQLKRLCLLPLDVYKNNRKRKKKNCPENCAMLRNPKINYKQKPKIGAKRFTNAMRTNTVDEKAEIEGYIMEGKIGEGAHSVVHLATYNGKRMACKIIDKEHCSKLFVKKFLPRELEITIKLDHPNIVKLFKTMEMSDFLLFFFEFCELGDLADYIFKEGPIHEPLAQFIFRQILSAVEYIHKLKIAHRDIKCENILLTANLTAKLGDFGLSRICNQSLSNTFCGSSAYMAPEMKQFNFYSPLLADIWAVGCVLYTLLTGVLPFISTNRLHSKQLDNKLNCMRKSGITEKAMDTIKSLLKLVPEERIPITEVLKMPWFHFSSSTPRTCCHNHFGN